MKPLRIAGPRARFALAAGLLVLGCARAPTQYFTLGAVEPDAAPLAVRPELGLAVGPIEFPRYLDRPEIVTRDGTHGLVLSNRNRWAGSLRNDVLRVLADDLARLLGTSRVVVFPNEPRYRLDYRVLIDLRELDGAPGESASLRLRWTLASGADGRALAVEEAHVVEPTASASYADLVAAWRAALGTVSRAIAARLTELPAAAGAR